MSKVIIVEPGSSTVYIANAVRLLGYEPVILCTINEYSGDHKRYIQEHGYHEVNAQSADNIVQCILEHKINDVIGIISTADRFISQACKAAMILGVKSMDPALLKLNNKVEVQQLIKEDSPPSIIFNKDSIPYDALKSMLKQASAIVFKPSMSAGAKGLFEINSEQEIDNIYELMKREKEVKVLEQDWIAQTVINGTLYSLEGYVLDGKVNCIGLSRRNRIRYTESQNIFPVETENQKVFYELKRIVTNIVSASSYKNGYFHSEAIYNGEKAYLIDANFGRVGGATIALQIALACGKKVEEIYAHVIETTLFHNNRKNFYPEEKLKTFSVYYSVDKDSKFIEINLPTDIKCNHILLADKGKYLKPAGTDNRSWVGILTGMPGEVQKEIEQITITTDCGILSPVY